MSRSSETDVVVVRCPSSRCRERFPVPRARVGRNVYCLSCGTRLTARPASVDDTLEERAEKCPAGGSSPVARLPFRAVVDNVRSLWNVGSIFRTADGCGVESLALAGITGHPPRSEITKTALGAEDLVRWAWYRDAVEPVEAARREGYEVVALEHGPGAPDVAEVGWDAPVCLIVGNEVAGIGPDAADAADRRVAIPMLGTKTSFNVAVAFGIAARSIARGLIQSRVGPSRGVGHRCLEPGEE